MKPKTKIEFKVSELSSSLNSLTTKQIAFADKQFFQKQCFATKNHGFCLECGNSIDTNEIRNNKVQCLFCGSKLDVVLSRAKKYASDTFFMGVTSLVKDSVYDFQLSRIFEFKKYYKKGEKSVLSVREICQNWYEAGGKRVIVSKMLNGFTGNYYGDMEIRRIRALGYGYHSTYDPNPHIYCPTSQFRDEYIKRGISSKIKGLDLKFLLKYIEKPKVETLLKAEFYDILDLWSYDNIEKYWDTLKICLRNNYKPKDAGMYKDLLEALAYLEKDLRNSQFVCPKNLKKSHDFYIDKRCEKEIGKELKKIQDMNPKFLEEKMKFSKLLFTNNEITIQPLKNVEDFLTEGTVLKHCVFKNAYYKKKDSLVLSARIKGKPIETIEVCLKKFTIKQCHGYDNKNSKYHAQILNLVNSNIPKIRRIALNSSTRKAA